MEMLTVADIRNYTINFVSGRPAALTCAARKLACDEVDLHLHSFTVAPSMGVC
jgi:hypothetical protein